MDELRPLKWDDYIGQEQMKATLRIQIAAANERDAPLENILLIGDPGCGKTTLARLIAQEKGDLFESYVMPVKPAMMKKIVYSHPGIVLFDEIHRLSVRQQEDLLPLIEDGYLQLDSGAKIHAAYLTVIGATTEPQDVIPPLLDRFQIRPPFDPYTDIEMGRIVMGMADKLYVNLNDEQAQALGRATGGIPRNAKSIVNMARDLNSTDVPEILGRCRLTPDGLTEMHIRYLRILRECGGVAGIEIVAAHLSMPRQVLTNLEKLLVKRDMIEYTKQGRQLTGNGYKAVH